MRVLIKEAKRLVHRALCLMTIHAPERVFVFDKDSDEFKPDGWFCGVCSKTWEEK